MHQSLTAMPSSCRRLFSLSLPQRTLTISSAVFALLSLHLMSVFAFCAEPIDRPNIVLIMADDLGVEVLGSYGGTSYKTPALDKLAREGVRFTHAYAQPLCANTRLQLMTGLYNHRNWIAFGILDPSAKTFGHWMQEAGYKTCIGIFSTASSGLKDGVREGREFE